jgi:hypothetical protein
MQSTIKTDQTTVSLPCNEEQGGMPDPWGFIDWAQDNGRPITLRTSENDTWPRHATEEAKTQQAE